jgi:hypothetical protein
MTQISPYKIAVPQAKLDRLKQKLALADFPDELEEASWDYGVPLADIKRLTAYWHNGYDWRKAEAELNETLPQFTVDIPVEGFETLKIHFVHQKSEVKGAIPLLFAHGWPGSFDEVRKIIPDLVKGGKDSPAFHVVAPSLPNFGFSQGTKKVRNWLPRVLHFVISDFRGKPAAGLPSTYCFADYNDPARVHCQKACRSMLQIDASSGLHSIR